MSGAARGCWRRIGVYGGDHSCERLPEVIHCRNCPVFHQAARSVFDRESDAEPASAQLVGSDSARERSALVFRIGAQWLGLSTRRLAEVAADRIVRRLAHRTAGRLEGAVNVRGELHLCVSLAELLGLGTRVAQRGDIARLILLRDATGALLAFRSDEVRGLQRYSVGDVEPPPDTLAESLRVCVEGLLPDVAGRIALLRDDAVVDAMEEALFE